MQINVGLIHALIISPSHCLYTICYHNHMGIVSIPLLDIWLFLKWKTTRMESEWRIINKVFSHMNFWANKYLIQTTKVLQIFVWINESGLIWTLAESKQHHPTENSRAKFQDVFVEVIFNKCFRLFDHICPRIYSHWATSEL